VKRDIHIDDLRRSLSSSETEIKKLTIENDDLKKELFMSRKKSDVEETPQERARQLTRELTKQFFNVSVDQSLTE
jgi:regulator of replication initiation timing